MLTTLIVTVLAVGGAKPPPGFVRGPMVGSHIEVVNSGGTVLATSELGNISLRLGAGRYRVVASLHPNRRVCQTATAKVRPGRPTRVTLYCSIK
jgi:hypothetical protein